MEQEILHRGQPQPLEFLQHLAADALEAVERDFIQFHQLDARKHCKYVQMIGVVEARMQAALQPALAGCDKGPPKDDGPL
ncbi:hypothetical protein [Aeromonas taiwanensis]|uniref:hypothetical protein n=1 Tax=Aeromonas taiwanensis TaxID=633417 RepID=UPI001427D6D2|nr:hypothetical protein [Aeromonas taiwanensis]